MPGPGPYEFQDKRRPEAVRDELLAKVQGRARLKPRHHVQSLLFGLGCGGLALLLVLFSFFNELVIAPFIQPSRSVSATPIIIGADGIAPTEKAEVIIPKINVQIPLVFDVPTIKENDVQRGLERGVVHYPTTAMPGQKGNATFFGHSSNNIFNPGQYKFAFVLLHELVPGDTFYLTRDGVAYAYQVIDKKIVEPTEIGILDPIPGKTATATLITCDPPGTTLRRLAVIGEQVSPDPNANTPATPAGGTAKDDGAQLPGDAPSLWRRLTGL
jgi:sortase A